mgnify:CR=1 FL=1
MRRSVAGLLISAALVSGGCLSSIIPDPAPADSIYRLITASNVAVPTPDATVFRIDRPTAPAALMSYNVIVSPDGQRLASASQARWAENIPSLIQTSFFDMLSTRESIVGVLPTSGARSDLRAHITVRNFEALFDNGEASAPLAVVHYTATVSNATSRVLIGTLDVRKTERANAPNVSSIVAATNSANTAALSDIADWMEGLKVTPET